MGVTWRYSLTMGVMRRSARSAPMAFRSALCCGGGKAQVLLAAV